MNRLFAPQLGIDRAGSFLALSLLLGVAVARLAAASLEPTAGRTGSISGLSDPPPLQARVIAMMQTNVLGPIESRIFFVEHWELTRLEKAQVLFAMLAEANADDQRKLAHAAVPFVANSNFAVVSQHLLNPRLPKTVLSALMTDMLKRNYSIKLPTILSLAQLETHPMKHEARELLQGYLRRNHGTNWAKWEESIQARLNAGVR